MLIIENSGKLLNLHSQINQKNSQDITIVEGNDIVSDSQELVRIFSKHFSNAVRNLGVDENPVNITDTISQEDPVLSIIEKPKSHLSIIAIQQNASLKTEFRFETVSCNTILKIIQNLDSSKTTVFKSIPIKIFKNHVKQRS